MTCRYWITALLVLAAAAPAKKPSPPPPAPAHDPLVDEAVTAIANQSLPQFRAKVDAQLNVLLGNLNKPDLPRIVRLGALREFVKYFSRLKDPTDADRQALAWLVQEPQLDAALMSAVTPFDPPDRVLGVLRGLRDQLRGQVARVPNLATALAVVWDAPERFGSDEDAKLNPRKVVRLFNYFLSAPLRNDVRRMPVELLVYVVDMDLTDDELDFVHTRYEGVGTAGVAFFDVPYDEEASYDPSRRAPDERARTLQNLQRRGGTFPDAAWYAASIAKALGVPAAASRGQGVTAGAPPAWVGFLKNGEPPTWDLRSGRRDEHEFWIGEVADPQTNQTIRDDELSILAGLAGDEEIDRFAAAFLAKSADLLPAEKRMGAFTKAIEICPDSPAAWNALIDFITHDKPADLQVRQSEELVRKHLVRRFPAFALSVRLRLVKGRSSADQHASLKRAAEMFRERRDLYAAARIAEGDLYRDEKRPKDALAAYGQALEADEHSGPTAVVVMNRVDPLLQRSQELERLAAIYRQTMGAIQRPRASAHARTTPFFIIGRGYEEILGQLHEESLLTGVRAQLDALMLPGTGTRQ